MRRIVGVTIGVLVMSGLLGTAGLLSAEPIDVTPLRQPWPREVVREFEVGRYPVRWRHRVSRKEGLFAGVRFEAPLPRQAIWNHATDYSDIGRMTPGVKAVRFLEQSPTRQVIQLDLKILWKELQVTFEVEQEPPQQIRFRWQGGRWGEFVGLCVFEEAVPPRVEGSGPGRTTVELAMHFQPSRPLPLGLLLVVERAALLTAVREFLEACEHEVAVAHSASWDHQACVA